MDLQKVRELIPNRKAKEVFGRFGQRKTVSKQDLLEQSGLPVTTLTRILEELTEAGWIVEAGLGESTGGRRPILYRVNPRRAYMFGLDISRVYARLLLFDLSLARLDARIWPMTAATTPAVLIDEVSAAVTDMIRRLAVDRSQVLGIGVGAVGPLDREAGMILDPLHFPSPGWRDVPIRAMLENKCGFPVLLDNGANAALFGEYWADPSGEWSHWLYVHAGVGLRSAMMTDGKLVYGATDMEGAVGQMIIRADGRPPRNPGGNAGSLEAYCSIPALEEAAARKLAATPVHSVLREWAAPGGRSEGRIAFPHILEALRLGDPLATELLTEAAVHFGIGLANLLNVMHPQKVILGGTLVASHDLFFRTATEVALKNTYYYPRYQAVFGKGVLGEDAVATGAALMVARLLTE